MRFLVGLFQIVDTKTGFVLSKENNIFFEEEHQNLQQLLSRVYTPTNYEYHN